MQCIQIIKDYNKTTIKKKENKYVSCKTDEKNINNILRIQIPSNIVQMINEVYAWKRAISKNIMVNRIFTMIPWKTFDWFIHRMFRTFYVISQYTNLWTKRRKNCICITLIFDKLFFFKYVQIVRVKFTSNDFFFLINFFCVASSHVPAQSTVQSIFYHFQPRFFDPRFFFFFFISSLRFFSKFSSRMP